MPTSNTKGTCLARIRIRARLRGQTKSTVQIARFILNSPDRARSMSIEALGAACGASAATISRFCRSLGYRGFKEFQLDLATATAQRDGFALDSFPKGTGPEAIIHRVFERHRQDLIDTERLLDRKTLLQVARLIHRARRIFLVGIGGSGLMAREGAQRFLSLGLTAVVLEDPALQILATTNMGRGDVVLGISHTGQTGPVVEAIRRARSKGARTIALTNYPQSPLAAESDYALITAHFEHRINVAVSTSRIAQICVLYSLYFILGSWGGGRAKKLAEEAERIAERILRHK